MRYVAAASAVAWIRSSVVGVATRAARAVAQSSTTHAACIVLCLEAAPNRCPRGAGATRGTCLRAPAIAGVRMTLRFARSASEMLEI